MNQEKQVDHCQNDGHDAPQSKWLAYSNTDMSFALTVPNVAQAFSSWQILLVDLRCHGDSAHIQKMSSSNTVESAAADVLELLRHLKLFPEVLIGHSFGGKVVMSMADQFGRIGPRLPRPVQVTLAA